MQVGTNGTCWKPVGAIQWWRRAGLALQGKDTQADAENRLGPSQPSHTKPPRCPLRRAPPCRQSPLLPLSPPCPSRKEYVLSFSQPIHSSLPLVFGRNRDRTELARSGSINHAASRSNVRLLHNRTYWAFTSCSMHEVHASTCPEPLRMRCWRSREV